MKVIYVYIYQFVENEQYIWCFDDTLWCFGILLQVHMIHELQGRFKKSLKLVSFLNVISIDKKINKN